MKSNTLAIALASLLVGGVAVAAFEHSRDSRVDATPAAVATTPASPADVVAGDVRDDASIAANGKLDYAEVTNVVPVTEKQKLYAQVIGTEPVR